MNADDEYLTVKEGAKLLGVSEFTIRDAIRDNRIKSEVILGKIAISRLNLDEYKAKTQPHGVPRVGRPSSPDRAELKARLTERRISKPYTLEELIQKRKTVRRILGARMRIRRIELGWSQQLLGDKLGFSRELISLYEAGQSSIRLEDLPLIAEVLEVHLLWFFANIPDEIEVDPIWAHYSTLTAAEKAILSDVADGLARRRGMHSQETINFDPEIETEFVDKTETKAS